MKATRIWWAGLVACAVLQGCASTGGAQQAAPAVAPAPSGPVSPSDAALAATPVGKPVVKADTKDNFEAVVAAIQKQMQPGGRWQFIDKNERATIDGNFSDMRQLYDRFGGVDKMDQAAKVRLLADQSSVNAILTKRDGERLVCRNEIPVGSHLPVQTCKTYAQRQMEERGAQQMLENANQRSLYQNTNGLNGSH